MISYSMISRPGSRQCNEDSVEMCTMEGNYVFTLADGLGGHGGGDEASACVTGEAIDVFRRERDMSICLMRLKTHNNGFCRRKHKKEKKKK